MVNQAIVLAVFVGDIAAITQILDSRESGLRKLLWALFVVLVPPVGMILWFWVGNKN